MAITFHITPPVTAEALAEAREFLDTLDGGYGVASSGTTWTTINGELDPDKLTFPRGATTEPTPPETETLAKSSTGSMIPWDERIHSKGKTVNADGSWRLKRGVDDATLKAIEAELLAGMTEAEPKPGIQSEFASETTPPPGAAEALNNTQPIAPPPPPVTTPTVEIRYKHGDQTFARGELLAANWTEEQIAALETVEVPAVPAAPTQIGAPMNFAEVAMRLSAEGVNMDEVNMNVAAIGERLGRPTVNQFALLAVPDNADMLAELVATLWPSA